MEPSQIQLPSPGGSLSNSQTLDTEELKAIHSISPRPEANNNDQDNTHFFEDDPSRQPTDLDNSLTLPKGALGPDIDAIDGAPMLPPIIKQLQRKPSTRAWAFREILSDMKTGLFEDPTIEQLDELWTYVDSDKNGVLDRDEILTMLERYIELCQVIAKKQIQKQQNVMRRMAGRNNRRMSLTLGKLASKTQVVCNHWIHRLHTNPEGLVDQLISDLVPAADENTLWTKEEFYKKAPQALERLKKKLKMHEWAEKAAELVNLDEETILDEEAEMEEEKPNKKKRLEGILTIKVVGALDLKPDEGRELCSPYCILHVGNKKLPTIFLNNTDNPEWSQKFRFTRYRFKFGQSRQGTLYVMDWSGEKTGASLVGFADFKIPDSYVEDAQQIELTLRDNNESIRGYLTITLSLQPKRPEYVAYDSPDTEGDA